MKTIIAGSRTIQDYEVVVDAIRASGFDITTVVCGMAPGVDLLGHAYAVANSINILEMPANWEAYGRRAGYLRNVDMANEADCLIAIWDGTSKGTGHMINIARNAGLKVFVYNPYEIQVEKVDDGIDREQAAFESWLADRKDATPK